MTERYTVFEVRKIVISMVTETGVDYNTLTIEQIMNLSKIVSNCMRMHLLEGYREGCIATAKNILSR